jgi:hypothetical protein
LTILGGLLAAGIALPAAAGSDPVPGCEFDLSGVPSQYAIGVDAPAVTVSGDCLGKDLWAAKVGVYFTANPGIGVASLTYGGCSPRLYDSTTNKCANSATSTFTPVSTATLNVPAAGTFQTRLINGAAYDFVFDGTTGIQYYAPTLPTTDTFTAKFATTTTLGVTKSGTTRTFTITPQHYSVSAKGYVNSVGTVVQLQDFVNGAWATVKTLTANTVPLVYSLTSSTAQTWRVVTPETTSNWSSTSASVTS